MPSYDYRCEKCEKVWEEMHLVAKRDSPCKLPCPSCNKKNVTRHIGIGAFPQTKVDTTLSANKKTGGRWNELMSRVKDYTPDRFHDRLDESSSRRGRGFRG